jgi:hypothetical protein
MDLDIQITTIGEKPSRGANPFYPTKGKIITETAGRK